MTGSSDEGETETGHSEVDDPDNMRVQDQEDEGIDIKEEPGTPEVDEPRDFLLPPELELRNFGVWARIAIARGARFGPFLGKWTSERPDDPQAYWEVQVGDGIKRFMDASGDNWLKHVKSTKTQDAQNLRPIWAGQLYYETTQQVSVGQELLLPPREPLQLDYLLRCGQAADDRSDRESASQHSGTCDEDREDEVEEEEETSCNVCGKNFSDNDHLDEHLIVSHRYPRNRHRCKQCPRAFSSQPGLSRHVTSHSRKYSCENCSTVFTDRSNLQRHIRTSHVGARSHACSACGKTFASSSGLKQHSHIHSSVKPFQCVVCYKSYTQFSNLCRHKRMHEGCRRNVECKCCGQTFSTTNLLAKHKRFCDARAPTTGTMPHIPPHSSPNPYLLYPRPPFYPPPSVIPPYHHPAMFPAGHPAASFLSSSLINQTHKLNEENLGLKPVFMNGKLHQYYPAEDHLLSLLKDKGELDLMRRSITPPTSTHHTFGFNKASPNVGEEAVSKPSPARPIFSGTCMDPKESPPDPEINVVDIQPEPHDLSTSSEDKHSPESEKTGSPEITNALRPDYDQPLDLRIEGKRKVKDIKNEDEEDSFELPKKKFKRHVRFGKDDYEIGKDRKCRAEVKKKFQDIKNEDTERKYTPRDSFESPSRIINTNVRYDKEYCEIEGSPKRFDSPNKSKCDSPVGSTNSSVSPMDVLAVRPKQEHLNYSPPPPSRSPLEKYLHTSDSKLPSMVCPIPIHPHPSIRFDSMMYRNHFPNFPTPDSNTNHERFMSSQLPQYQTRFNIFASMVNGMAHSQGIPRPPLDMLRPPLQHFGGGSKPYHEVLNPQPDSVNGNKMKDRYTCKYCGKIFPRSANLTRHLRTHTGEQPYKCKYCERCFSISSNLQRHVRNIHNKEKPFKCSLCDRCFGQQTNLDRHLKKHEGDDGSGIGVVADSPGSSNENDGEDACVEIRNFVGRVAYSNMDSFSHNLNLNLLSQFKLPTTPTGQEHINSTTNPAEEEDSEMTMDSDRDSPQESPSYPYRIGKTCYQDSPMRLAVNKGLEFMRSKDISSPTFDVKLKAEQEESAMNNNISEAESIHVSA